MKRHLTTCGLAVLFLTFSAPAQVPIYNVTVTERTTSAVNYQYRSGPTQVDFRGTVLMPQAKGKAIVESKRGRTEIEVTVDNLVPPTRFGREYLTYTLWAITPEGAPHNIGEVIPNGGDKAKLHVTTDLQSFGLIVTAEPYSTARQPSDVVVLENEVRPDTVGQIKEIQARYELMPRGHYTWNVSDQLASNVAGMPKVSMDRYEAMLELYEAQNATGIARAANAEEYAPQVFEKALSQLANAQRLEDSKAAGSLVVQAAREAAQTAEDARTIAEKRRQETKAATLEAETARAQLLQAQATNEAQRARVEADSARAEAAAERTARQQAEANAAEASRRAAEVPPVVVVAPTPAPTPAPSAQADPQKTQLRLRLMDQLNAVLATRDTPRGLVVTLPDSSFNRSELRPAVASQLARIVAILNAYPDLRLTVEGYSDTAATESEARRRAESVHQTMIGRGLPASRCDVRALGDSRPLMSNAAAPGRQQNRRVEIVVSGDPIGTLPSWDRTYSLTQR